MTNVVIMRTYNIDGINISLLNEPAVFYTLENDYARIAGVLGGFSQIGQVVNSDIELIAITRNGLPKSVLKNVASILNISMEQLSSLLHVSFRTIQRKQDVELLNVTISEQLIEMASVVSHGIAVFDTLENFQKWLHLEIRALDFKKPIAFFDTGFGLDLINKILGRIEHGVYS